MNIITIILRIARQLFFIVGTYKMFEKSHIEKWRAFIPVHNDYNLAKSADCEDEVSAYIISKFFFYVFSLAYEYMAMVNRGESLPAYMMSIMTFTIAVVVMVYEIRIYNSLCNIYSVKKRWTVAWIFAPGITSMIWGFSDKFMPSRVMAPETKTESKDRTETAALSEGLTINIKERVTRKGFSKKTLLKDINLSIEPGKMILLLGGSGAGKTTFFNAVTGYEQADATIMLNGMNVYENFNKMKYEIGFVPQQELIRENDSVYRTLMDSAMLRLPDAVSNEERRKKVEEVMELFGLTAIKDNIVKKQSGGQKKRISIATEYISNPSLFILDEPDSGLDGILARELMQRLHDISRQGKIVIVITHTPDRVIDLFDQIIVLAKDEKRTGRLVFFGGIDEARKFFKKDKMEDIVKVINRPDEGGDGKADELIAKFEEGRNGR